ncbi:MAG: hypothetical protein IJY05_03145 [Clostridia bacterium]|nr:hypothetical protein [Clostridia bacterium]
MDYQEMKKKDTDEAKVRVEQELIDLNEKIVKLTNFIFGPKLAQAKLSRQMVCELENQLTVMQQYAKCLQRRLEIWGKTDEELRETVNKIGCCY